MKLHNLWRQENLHAGRCTDGRSDPNTFADQWSHPEPTHSEIHRNNARFDMAKIQWLAGEYLREVPDDRFRALGRAALGRAGIDLSAWPAAYVEAALDT